MKESKKLNQLAKRTTQDPRIADQISRNIRALRRPGAEFRAVDTAHFEGWKQKKNNFLEI